MSTDLIKIDVGDIQDEVDDLGGKVVSDGGTFQPRTMNNKSFIKSGDFVLLIDESSSMNSSLEDGMSKKERVYNEIENFSVPKVYFSSKVQEQPFSRIEMAGTYIAKGLAYCLNKGWHNVVIVTDGETYDQSECLMYAKQMHIDVIFIGTDYEYSKVKDFLEKLCSESGGQQLLLSEVGKAGALTDKIKLLTAKN